MTVSKQAIDELVATRDECMQKHQLTNALYWAQKVHALEPENADFLLQMCRVLVWCQEYARAV